MFDISKSKLYSQIMSACASFFSLGADASEADIHEAVEGKETLAAQLEAARTAAVSAQAEQLTTITAQLATMQTELSALRIDVDAKDARIAELQVEATANTKAAETAAAQHNTEIKVLAGQLSALKAGKALEIEEGDEGHEAGKEKADASKQTVITSDSLKALVAARRN